MRTYNVTISDTELDAMSRIVMYGRAIAQTLPDQDGSDFARRLKVYAQIIEDITERIERSPYVSALAAIPPEHFDNDQRCISD